MVRNAPDIGHRKIRKVEEDEEADKKEDDRGSRNVAGGLPSSRQLESELSDETNASRNSPGPIIPDLVTAGDPSEPENASHASSRTKWMEKRDEPRGQELRKFGNTLYSGMSKLFPITVGSNFFPNYTTRKIYMIPNRVWQS
jgi:hypothetical protein